MFIGVILQGILDGTITSIITMPLPTPAFRHQLIASVRDVMRESPPSPPFLRLRRLLIMIIGMIICISSLGRAQFQHKRPFHLPTSIPVPHFPTSKTILFKQIVFPNILSQQNIFFPQRLIVIYLRQNVPNQIN